MGTVLKGNELNQVKEGTVLFKKGDQVRFFGMIAKGSIRIQNNGFFRIARQGTMVAVTDLFYNEYLGDYTAEEDTIFYAFRAIDSALLESFLNSNFDYRGIAVYSILQELTESVKIREKLFHAAEEMFRTLQVNYDAAMSAGIQVSGQYLEEEPKNLFHFDNDKKEIFYYQECAKVPIDIQKKYYYYSSVMAFYQTEKLSSMIYEIMQSNFAIAKYIEDISNFNISIKNSIDNKPEEQPSMTKEEIRALLKNSLVQILKYANIEKAEQNDIISLIDDFVNAKDRTSTQDDMRKIKKQITTYYYTIYQSCIFKWLENPNVPLAIKMFLNYGFIDERLLEEDHIFYLCDRLNVRDMDVICPIYTVPEWLREIYEGRKEPSRDSFEQDYTDTIRKEKKNGKITEKQEREFLSDNRRKVIFELNNMITSNNKVVNGKLSTYVPILYSDEIYGKLERIFVTKKQLSDAIIDLEKIDFTIFNREIMYRNPELNIEKEYVIKHVYPDVILAPVYGTASSMWQEITGKRRDTPGRFIFPIISENEIPKLVAKAFGRFHWEYCRCEMGASWNNIQYKSLTSEYIDYIQFYRKNHDLSEEKREKIKLQILRARNNSREIFLSDYEMWIYSEINSAIKLNKVSRSILATYCPFNKSIRDNLKSNTVFADAMARQQRFFSEKEKEWEMRIKKRENNHLEVPEEFYETYHYYADN